MRERVFRRAPPSSAALLALLRDLLITDYDLERAMLAELGMLTKS